MKNFAIKSFALVLGVATALVAGQYVITPETNVAGEAMWAHHFETPTGLVAGADLVVVAEHVSSQPGRVAGTTPFTDNGFLIHQVLKGRHVGRELIVEQTGGFMDDGRIFFVNDGGAYQPGQQYLLFLKGQGNGVYFLINDQGRYEVGTDGRLVGLEPDDRVVASFHGRDLERAVLDVAKRAAIVR